ncbi:MAG: hypothetical protein Kow00120_24530 [Anaerolineae bacterium]
MLARLHLMRVNARIVQAETTLLLQYGLTPSQFYVLSRLVRHDGLSQQALADRLLVTKGNICGLIDRLEKLGLVKRLPDPGDRRSYRLQLTEAGRRAFEAAAPALEATVAHQMEALTDDELAALMGLLARLDRSLR